MEQCTWERIYVDGVVAGMTKVFLVDDETLLRAGLRELLGLEPSFEVVGDASSGEEALARVAESGADLVLMDVRMPGMDGPATTAALREAGCSAKVLLITTFDDDLAMVEGLKAGACGYLRKDVTLDQLRQAIEDVMAGKTVLRPAVSERGFKRLKGLKQNFESSELPEALTPKEGEVLRLMASGLSNREIGELLGTSEGTVKTHASTILGKLGVRDRTRAVLKALDLGLL
jgi:DNA-binding NarL/FixJ family response regulator